MPSQDTQFLVVKRLDLDPLSKVLHRIDKFLPISIKAFQLRSETGLLATIQHVFIMLCYHKLFPMPVLDCQFPARHISQWNGAVQKPQKIFQSLAGIHTFPWCLLNLDVQLPK